MINLDDIDITQTPPTHEPERQYYYMAKARQYVKKKSEELGRPLTLFLKTFGWQMLHWQEKQTGEHTLHHWPRMETIIPICQILQINM